MHTITLQRSLDKCFAREPDGDLCMEPVTEIWYIYAVRCHVGLCSKHSEQIRGNSVNYKLSPEEAAIVRVHAS